MKNKTFFSLYVPLVSYILYEKLDNEEKLKLCSLLENEFTYLVNCLISERVDNGLVFSYTTLNQFLKERKENL